MSTFVKICGICSQGDLEQISAFGPDAIGFVQWPKSGRYVAPARVGEWELPEGMKRVGVFVNPTEDELLHAYQVARLDVLQVHRVASGWLVDRARFPGAEFWNAVNPDEGDMTAFAFAFDRFLLDSYDPKTIGGTGKTCDWNRAQEMVAALKHPVLLAGGLSPENVAQAIEQVQPWGVDVSSGVELEVGRKDIDKVARFISAARRSGQ